VNRIGRRQTTNLQLFSRGQTFRATAISDASWRSIGAPIVWLGEPKQAVIKGSIANNLGKNYDAAPAIVLFREAPSATALAVKTIP